LDKQISYDNLLQTNIATRNFI